MHKFGIVHGDIHFNNILQADNGKLILTDYGCSSFNKMIHKDFQKLGLCFLRLLRLHLQLDGMFVYELLIKLRDKSYGNTILSQACDLAELMVDCNENTTNKVITHTFLKKKYTLNTENFTQSCTTADKTKKVSSKLSARRPFTALCIEQNV